MKVGCCVTSLENNKALPKLIWILDLHIGRVRHALRMNEDLWLLDLFRLHLPTGWSFILHGRLNALHSDYLFRFFAVLVILNADILVVGAGLREASVVFWVENAGWHLIELALLPCSLLISIDIGAVWWRKYSTLVWHLVVLNHTNVLGRRWGIWSGLL